MAQYSVFMLKVPLNNQPTVDTASRGVFKGAEPARALLNSANIRPNADSLLVV